MNRQQQGIMDRFINENKGQLKDGCSWYKINDTEFTKEEFQQRARELGWCNGYRYGVEYETNGKKPDLPDDVTVLWRGLGPWHTSYVGRLNWSLLGDHTKVKFFRIVDQRYKPVDEQEYEPVIITSTYIAVGGGVGGFMSKSEPGMSKECLNEEWYDYEQQKAIALPPVGAEVEVKPYWHKAVVVCHRDTEEGIDIVFWDKREQKYDWVNFWDYLRPIDHSTRAKELEKKRVVDACAKEFGTGFITKTLFDMMYDKGFLKLP